MNKIILVFAVVLLAASAFFYFGLGKEEEHLVGEVHKHADFAVYLNGERINFSQDKYMSNGNKTLSPFMHLHDGDGGVIHQHINGKTLGVFFKSLKMGFNSTCFTPDDGRAYCADSVNQLKFYVNGRPNSNFGEYEFEDLDRLLITYGRGNLEKQLASVTENACISSNKCPEKGTPKNESSCTTGNGCVAVSS